MHSFVNGCGYGGVEGCRWFERLSWKRQRQLDDPPPRRVPYEILFVGNSHTYMNDVPGLIAEPASTCEQAIKEIQQGDGFAEITPPTITPNEYGLPDAGTVDVPADDAAFLQEVAWKAAEQWRRKTNALSQAEVLSDRETPAYCVAGNA